MSVDSGLVVVGLITLTYIVLVFGLFFYVKNEWCELLFKNNTVQKRKKERSFIFSTTAYIISIIFKGAQV
jgi:hypothetical protein